MRKLALGLLMSVCSLFVLILQACTSKQEPAVITKPSQEHLLGKLSFKDTLIISAIYSECGEFGGHRELIKVYHEERDYDNFEE